MGLVFDIKKFAIHDGPGIRTTVFFSGCPLSCKWCHNPECRVSSNGKTREMTVLQVIDEIIKDVIFYDESDGGVTFSGGEPLMQPEFLLELLQNCRQLGIHTSVDTCGYTSREDLESILPYSDLLLFDLKIFDPEVHENLTGVSNELILENLEYVSKMGFPARIRIPLVPGYTDASENIKSIADYLAELPMVYPVDLLKYNLFTPSKYKRLELPFEVGDVEEQSKDTLEALGSIFKEQELEVTW